MLLRNLDMQQPSNMLVNGSRGVIVGFRKKEASGIAKIPCRVLHSSYNVLHRRSKDTMRELVPLASGRQTLRVHEFNAIKGHALQMLFGILVIP